MNTFWELWENLQQALPADQGGVGTPRTKAMLAIEKGLNPANKKGEFWTTFKEICNNYPEGLADLLKIDKTKVSSWMSLIDAALADYQGQQAEPNQSRSTVIVTGNQSKATPRDSYDTPETRPIGT